MFSERENRDDLAEKTARALVSDYPIHSFAILRDEAERALHLTIKKAEERSDWAGLEAICRTATQYEVCICAAKRYPLDIEKVLEEGVQYADEDEE
jgi:hypothetical protein